MGKAIPDGEPVILDLPVSRLPRVGLDGGGVVQEFMQALPIDLVSVGYDGLVVAASLSHTVRPLAGAD